MCVYIHIYTYTLYCPAYSPVVPYWPIGLFPRGARWPYCLWPCWASCSFFLPSCPIGLAQRMRPFRPAKLGNADRQQATGHGQRAIVSGQYIYTYRFECENIYI